LGIFREPARQIAPADPAPTTITSYFTFPPPGLYFIVGDDGRKVIDAMMAAGWSIIVHFMEEICSVTNNPIRNLVDTHHHGK
jgi:glyoxylase-like metal-dependent hydrolase (beta-lactamase superfamily II)